MENQGTNDLRIQRRHSHSAIHSRVDSNHIYIYICVCVCVHRIPHITVWGSCFSLGSRRFSPSVRRVLPPRRLHNSSQPHFSHLTYHSTIHQAPLLTIHSSQLNSSQLPQLNSSQLYFRVAGAVHRASWSNCGARGRRWAAAAFHTTHRSSTYHTSLITAPLLIATHHSSTSHRSTSHYFSQVHFSSLLTGPLLITTHHNLSHPNS